MSSNVSINGGTGRIKEPYKYEDNGYSVFSGWRINKIHSLSLLTLEAILSSKLFMYY